MATSWPSTLYVSVDMQGTSILGLVARVASARRLRIAGVQLLSGEVTMGPAESTDQSWGV